MATHEPSKDHKTPSELIYRLGGSSLVARRLPRKKRTKRTDIPIAVWPSGGVQGVWGCHGFPQSTQANHLHGVPSVLHRYVAYMKVTCFKVLIALNLDFDEVVLNG